LRIRRIKRRTPTEAFPVKALVVLIIAAVAGFPGQSKTFVTVRRTPATRIMVIQNLRAFVQQLQEGGVSR